MTCNSSDNPLNCYHKYIKEKFEVTEKRGILETKYFKASEFSKVLLIQLIQNIDTLAGETVVVQW